MLACSAQPIRMLCFLRWGLTHVHTPGKLSTRTATLNTITSTHTHTRMHTHTLSLSLTHTLTHTHSHTHTLSVPLLLTQYVYKQTNKQTNNTHTLKQTCLYTVRWRAASF